MEENENLSNEDMQQDFEAVVEGNEELGADKVEGSPENTEVLGRKNEAPENEQPKQAEPTVDYGKYVEELTLTADELREKFGQTLDVNLHRGISLIEKAANALKVAK